MLLKDVEITYVSPCLADPSKIRLKARFSDDISEGMPYLNAVQKNAVYNHDASTLTLFKEYRLITLYPQTMTMIKALNTTDARQVIEWLQDLINDTYSRKDEIEPDYQMEKRPHPLQLYSWLPGTNCRQCGRPTCLSFALYLFIGEEELKKCKPLYIEEYREQKEVLLELAAALGHEIEA